MCISSVRRARPPASCASFRVNEIFSIVFPPALCCVQKSSLLHHAMPEAGRFQIRGFRKVLQSLGGRKRGSGLEIHISPANIGPLVSVVVSVGLASHCARLRGTAKVDRYENRLGAWDWRTVAGCRGVRPSRFVRIMSPLL
jgi:hypothetical protein